MKKFLFLMLTLLTLGFAAAPLSAQNTLTVADGSATNAYVPFYGYYLDEVQHTQVIYPESMLTAMVGNSIMEMTFYLTSTPSFSSNITISLGISTDATFSSTAFDATTTLTAVYTGAIVINNNEMTVAFDVPFSYTGGNLLFDLTNTTGNWISATFNGETATGASLNEYNSWSGISQRDFIPKTTFSYGTPSLCAKPMNVTASNATTNSADIAWLGDDNASSYTIEYMLSSESDWTNALTETSTTASVTLYNLLPSSTYKVRVQTVCSDNTSTNWSSVATFQTECDAITVTQTVSWFEDFEGYQGSGEQPFQCWATPIHPNGPFVYCGYSASCHSGSNSAEFKGSENMLVLPPFTNDIHELRLSFWATATTVTLGQVEVGVVTDPNDPTTFELVGLAGTPGPRDGVGNFMGPFDFNGVQASSGRIALRYTNTNSTASWNLDDFTVELSPSCNSPVKTSVTATNIDGHNATISWVDNDPTHTSWTLYYKMNTQTDLDWQAVTVNSDTFYTLSGLNPETTYNVYVVTNCDGTPSTDATITYNFTTLVACPAPTAVTASPVYINDATITWNSTATAFNIEYGESGFTQGSGTTETAYGNTITLTNLNAETSYTVYVQADCGTDDGTSQWASVQFTTLPSCPKPTQIHTSSITTTSADLEWTAGYQESEWELRYGAQGFNPDTSSVSEIVTGTPYFQLQNLTANTHYDVYIRAICSSSDTSAWSNLYSFLTPCDAAQLPLVENFDGYPSWYSPDCWRKFEAGNSGSYVSFGAYIFNEQAYSGDKALKLVAGSSASGYALLRLPDLDTYDITGLQVKFMAKKTAGTRPLIVGVTPDFNSVDSIVVLGNFADLTGDYAEKIVSLENYPSTTGYIVIGLPGGYNSSATIYVDDVTVEVRPNCMYPTDFTATSTSETSVTLSWTELGTSQSWNIEYGLTGFSHGDGTTEVVTDSTTYLVENLMESTAYDFYVQSNCGDMESQWVGPITVVTSQYNMAVTGSDTVTTCGMMIYDDGGANGDYSTDCNSILVLYPATPGTMMMLTGTSYTENNYDFLKIYDGVGTDGTLLANYTNQQNVSVISTTGPLTIHFTSDYTVVKSGFELMASCVACFPPSNVAASNPTLDGATITWSGNADSYTVYLSGAMSGEYSTTDTFYVFSGLTGSSTYNVQVRSFCGSDSSILSQAASFNTSCDAITVTETTPWFEDFESYAGSGEQPFVCWETPIHPNGPFVYCGHSLSCHSGSNSAEFKGSENLLVLPPFTNDIHELRLSFWATATTVTLGQVEVGVMTDPTDPTTFELLGLAGTPGPRGSSGSGHGNYMGPFDFNGVQATTGRIALRYTNTNSTASWNLDDFTVSLAPNCPSPVKTSVTATDVDGHNATISFSDNDPSHNSWTIYYKPSADSVWNQEMTTTTTTILTNLDPQTAYDVYVVTNCATPDVNEDATLTIHFTTTVACPAPTNVTVSNIGMTSATVTWNSNADSFTIEYGETGFTPGTGTTTTSTTNSVDLTGLTAGTAYTVYITADCGVDGSSTAASTSFNTNLCEVADQCEYIFNLNDSFGDGWNGASITVQQNGITVANVGFTSGSSATVNVTLCDGQSTTLIWNTGSYDSECSFEVVSSYGDVIYTATSVSAGTLTTFISNCTPPTCPKPTLLEVTNVTATSVTLDWQVNGSETSWEIVYGTPGFDPSTATNVENANAHPYTVQNLTDATSYEFYVRAVCAVDDQSDWSAPVSATTPCSGALTVPYTQDFEGYSGSTYTDNNGIAPACWTTYSANTTYGAPHIISSGSYHYAASGNSMVFTCSSAGSDAYAALPTFTDPLNTLKLNFWRAMESTSQGTLTVGYVTDLNDLATTFVTVATIPSVGSTSGDTISVNFNEAGIPANGNICFHWHKDDTYYSCCIDNVAVTLAGSGPGPVITDPTVATTAATAIGQTTATLNGTITNPDNVTITAKGFEWKATAGGTFTPVTVTGNDLTYNLTGLTANTGYTYKAFITFNGTTVYGNEVTFTTLPEDVQPCDVPTGLHTTTVENEAIAIAWDANPDVTSWNIQYRPVGGALASATSTTNSYNITGLTGLTTYEIQVQADCGDGNVSDWCTAITAQTTNVGIEEYLLNSISLFPNPANDVINVQCTMNNVQVTALEVFDVYGKLIRTVETVCTPSLQTQINVSDLAAGMYFVRVATEQGTATKSFVKK